MTEPYVSLMTWLGIVFCISQSAMFSGMNLALFSVGRLPLEIDASTGNTQAAKLLKIWGDSNFILTTVLWGMASPPDPLCYCHRPIVINDAATELGTILNQFKVRSKNPDDNVIEQDIVLVWGASKPIITGADILGRLMQGISIKHTVTGMEGPH